MRIHRDIAHDGNLDRSERTRMKFDENSIAHLMSVLTDLYSDPELAVVREYSTNAWDSHRAAGVDEPIEVELPTSLRPVFVVRDHGVGLSKDEVLENLSRYGWSSKRDTDNEAGMLGLGFKAALTYTSQFTVIATKDGHRATFLVTRDDDGCGAVQVMDETATDDRNGVEIQVPVSGIYTFNERANLFYRFWEPGSVLVNGEPVPVPIGTGQGDKRLDDDVVLTSSIRQHYLVMGNVPYPISMTHANGLVPPGRKGHQEFVVARVPIGSINFTPSREALQYTARTIDVVESVREFVNSGLRRAAQAEIDAAASHPEALTIAHGWRQGFALKFDFTYRGASVPSEFRFIDIHEETSASRAFAWVYRPGWEDDSDCRSERKRHMEILDARKAIHVIGHRGNGIQQVTKKRIEKYCEAKDIRSALVFLYPEPVGMPWLEGAHRITFEHLQTIPVSETEKPKATRRSGYLISNGTYHWNRVDSLPKHKVIVWLRASEDDSRYSHRWGALNNGRSVLVRVQSRSEAKFLRDHPNAVHAKDWLRHRVRQVHRAFTPFDVFKITHDDYRIRYGGGSALTWAGWLRPDRIDDPTLASMLSENGDSTRVDQWFNLVQLAKVLNVKVPEPDALAAKPFRRALVVALKRYPLLRTLGKLSNWPQDHDVEATIHYVNLIYREKQQLQSVITQPDTDTGEEQAA